MRLGDYFRIGHIRRYFPQLQQRLDLADAYQKAFATPEGRMVLRDLLQAAGLLDGVFDGADREIFKAGRRSLGVHIVDRLRWSAMEMAQLGQEMTAEQLAQMERALQPAEAA